MPHERFPDFLGIGAQKAGTTWLHENLKRHPEVWTPWVKEVQYFNEVHIPGHRAWIGNHRREHAQRAIHGLLQRNPGRPYNLETLHGIASIAVTPASDAWYGRVFSHAPADRICGEITPEYGLLPRAGIAHVRRLCPRARIILLLRDPIERTWSHLRMLAKGNPQIDFRQAAANEDVRQRANYPRMIRDWGRAFGEDALFVAFAEEIAADPHAVLRRVCGFLGIGYDAAHFPKATERVHVGQDMPLPEALHAVLRESLRPFYEALLPLHPEAAQRWMRQHDMV